MQVKVVIDCSCKMKMCEHAEHQMQDILQDLYDDAYDEGWRVAFELVNEFLRRSGLDAPSGTPEPPARKSKNGKAGRKKFDRELDN